MRTVWPHLLVFRNTMGMKNFRIKMKRTENATYTFHLTPCYRPSTQCTTRSIFVLQSIVSESSRESVPSIRGAVQQRHSSYTGSNMTNKLLPSSLGDIDTAWSSRSYTVARTPLWEKGLPRHSAAPDWECMGRRTCWRRSPS